MINNNKNIKSGSIGSSDEKCSGVAYKIRKSLTDSILKDSTLFPVVNDKKDLINKVSDYNLDNKTGNKVNGSLDSIGSLDMEKNFKKLGVNRTIVKDICYELLPKDELPEIKKDIAKMTEEKMQIRKINRAKYTIESADFLVATKLICMIMYNWQPGTATTIPDKLKSCEEFIKKSLNIKVFWALCLIPETLQFVWPICSKSDKINSAQKVELVEYSFNLLLNLEPYIINVLTEYFYIIVKRNLLKLDSISIDANKSYFVEDIFPKNSTEIMTKWISEIGQIKIVIPEVNYKSEDFVMPDYSQFINISKKYVKNINPLIWKTLNARSQKVILQNRKIQFLPAIFPIPEPKLELLNSILMYLNSLYFVYGFPHLKNDLNPGAIMIDKQDTESYYKRTYNLYINNVNVLTTMGGLCYNIVDDDPFKETWNLESFKLIEDFNYKNENFNKKLDNYYLNQNNTKSFDVGLNDNVIAFYIDKIKKYQLKWKNPTLWCSFILQNISYSDDGLEKIPQIGAGMGNSPVLPYTLLTMNTVETIYDKYMAMNGKLYYFADWLTVTDENSIFSTQELISSLYKYMIAYIYNWRIVVPYNSIIGCDYINYIHFCTGKNPGKPTNIDWKNERFLSPQHMFLNAECMKIMNEKNIISIYKTDEKINEIKYIEDTKPVQNQINYIYTINKL